MFGIFYISCDIIFFKEDNSYEKVAKTDHYSIWF